MINLTTLRKIADSIVRMRTSLQHIVTLILASASIVGLACAADPVPPRAPAVEAMKRWVFQVSIWSNPGRHVRRKVISNNNDNGGRGVGSRWQRRQGLTGSGAIAAVQDG